MSLHRFWTLAVLAALVSGCTTASTSNTARTSTEQLLLANAVDQSLDRVSFKSFDGYNVFLQDKYIDCVDKNYVIASTRHRLFRAGAHVVDDIAKADVVVELRSGAVGTSSMSSFLGTPEIVLPGMLSIPEVHFVERKNQEATAKIGLLAYDPKTSQLLGEGGVALSRSKDSNWFVAGIGPYQNGEVRKEVDRAAETPLRSPAQPLPVNVAFQPPALAPANSKQLAEGLQPVPQQNLTPAAMQDAAAAPWAAK